MKYRNNFKGSKLKGEGPLVGEHNQQAKIYKNLLSETERKNILYRKEGTAAEASSVKRNYKNNVKQTLNTGMHTDKINTINPLKQHEFSKFAKGTTNGEFICKFAFPVL